MNAIKAVAIGGFLATTLVAGSAFAKAHDQGSGGKNGNAGFTDVGQTVGAAQNLGSVKGNRPADRGPMNTASDNAGGPADRKAHDQGSGGKNGNAGFTDVGQTVGAAQNLGSVKGNRPADRGPMNTASDNAGGPADR